MISIPRIFLVFPFLLALAAYFLARRSRRMRRPAWHTPVDGLFLAYASFVVALLYFPLVVNYDQPWVPHFRMNLTPFVTTYHSYLVSVRYGLLDWIVPLLFGNLLIFVPLAFYLAFRFPDKAKRSFLQVLAISAGAEVLQFLLDFLTRSDRRVTDIDDLILNALGGIGGWLVARAILHRVQRRRRIRNAIGRRIEN